VPLYLYMDVHIPRAITNGLGRRGVEVLTAQEDGTAELDDPPLLDRATELNRLLYTQDDDLLAEARRRQTDGRDFLRGDLLAPAT
jgi:predicted nuclease of predicted toxin-antitoxin system